MKFFKITIFPILCLFFILFLMPFPTSAAEAPPLPVCYVRFSGIGLHIYADPSMSADQKYHILNETTIGYNVLFQQYFQFFLPDAPSWR